MELNPQGRIAGERNLKQVVYEALERGDSRCMVLDARDTLVDSSRAKEGVRPGILKMAAPDDVVRAVSGPRALAKFDLFVVAVPRSVIEGLEAGIVV